MTFDDCVRSIRERLIELGIEKAQDAEKYWGKPGSFLIGTQLLRQAENYFNAANIVTSAYNDNKFDTVPNEPIEFPSKG